MKTQIIFCSSLLVLACAFVACNTSAPNPTTVAIVEPTATAVPPTATNTLVPPTATNSPTATLTLTPTKTNTPTKTSTPTVTPSPTNTATATATSTPLATNTLSVTPTRTRAPATATPKLPPLAAAIRRSDEATSRFETLGFYSNPYQEVKFETVTGERSPQGSHYFIKGLFGTLLGASAESGAEVLRVGDKTYLKGPLPLFKADQARWYVLPADKDDVANSGDPDSFLTPEFKEFTEIGAEAVDGVGCQVYTIDKETARQRARDVLKVTEDQLGEIVNIEITFWACDDGLVHKSRFRVDVKNFFNPATTDIVRYETRYFDFGAPAQIAAPTDALPLPK